MRWIEGFINSLDKYELAFFYKYRAETYMEDTRQLIFKLMKSKGIDDDKAQVLIDERNEKARTDKLGGCPRCHSTRYFSYETEYGNISGKHPSHRGHGNFSGKLRKELKRECLVCGYDVESEFSNWSFWRNDNVRFFIGTLVVAIIVSIISLIVMHLKR